VTNPEQAKVVQLAPPEVIKERDFVEAAWAEVERGYRAAKARIAKGGDPDKAPDLDSSQ
jgi:hypothetical protein